jgi:hypothetical protein
MTNVRALTDSPVADPVSIEAQQVVGGILVVGGFILMAAVVVFVWWDARDDA